MISSVLWFPFSIIPHTTAQSLRECARDSICDLAEDLATSATGLLCSVLACLDILFAAFLAFFNKFFAILTPNINYYAVAVIVPAAVHCADVITNAESVLVPASFKDVAPAFTTFCANNENTVSAAATPPEIAS